MNISANASSVALQASSLQKPAAKAAQLPGHSESRHAESKEAKQAEVSSIAKEHSSGFHAVG